VISRNVTTTSSRNLSDQASLDSIRMSVPWDLRADMTLTSTEVLSALPAQLRRTQRLVASTGVCHAAALFTASGGLIASREDVGLYNAVDKVVGDAVRRSALPMRGSVLMVTGSLSFALVQKAVMAGIPTLAAVSAPVPSSSAVDLAEDTGLTLVAFQRPTGMNVYTGGWRIRGW
jgi:FdhD protein